MSDFDWPRIAERLNALLAQRRQSSHALAARAGVDRKTIDRLRAGQAVRPQTLQWIEQALQESLREVDEVTPAHTARVEVGGYRHDGVTRLIGHWLQYRRSFDRPRQLVAAEVRVYWEDSPSGLRFGEYQHNRTVAGKEYEYRFNGDVAIPPNLGVIHLTVQPGDGRVRTVSTSMPRDERGTLMMKGFLTTLNEIADIGYYPVVSPVILVKLSSEQESTRGQTGVLTPGHARFAWADRMLDEVERKFLPWRCEPAVVPEAP